MSCHSLMVTFSLSKQNVSQESIHLAPIYPKLWAKQFRWQSKAGQYESTCISSPLTISRQEKIRFCLSDGQTWILFVLKSKEMPGKKEKAWVFYESAPRQLGRGHLSNPAGTDEVSQLLVLILEWVSLLWVIRANIIMISSCIPPVKIYVIMGLRNLCKTVAVTFQGMPSFSFIPTQFPAI